MDKQQSTTKKQTNTHKKKKKKNTKKNTNTLEHQCTRNVLSQFSAGVCVEVLRPSQPDGVMSSAVSLPQCRSHIRMVAMDVLEDHLHTCYWGNPYISGGKTRSLIQTPYRGQGFTAYYFSEHSLDDGHLTRKPDERLPKKIFFGELKMGNRSTGGQNKR